MHVGPLLHFISYVSSFVQQLIEIKSLCVVF